PPLPSLHALPLGGVPTLYNIPVEPGRYEWVLAVWVKQGFNLTNADSTLRETGYYRDPADTSQPGAVTVAGGTAATINFVVDFAALVDTVVVVAGDSLERDYRLQAAVVELQPTIVTAAKHSQLLDQSVTSVALVSDTDLARRAVSTVDEAVNKAPGVLFLSGQVNIRGSSGFVEGLGSRVLQLVDGVPANQGDRGGIDWDMVQIGRASGREG